jgi:hypothetical protein
MDKKPIDKDFDGHLEKPLNKMTPKEKLDYIWSQIELKNYVKEKIKKIKK